MKKLAAVSDCGHYRWWLQREFTSGTGNVAFVMLNPSTADAYRDDPTLVRCMGFARSWGFRFLTVVNLFPYRSTEPKGLLNAPVDVTGGPRGLEEVRKAMAADRVVAAWGDWVPFGRDETVCKAAVELRRPMFCLGLTKMCRPRHPLYMPADAALQPFQLKEQRAHPIRKVRKP